MGTKMAPSYANIFMEKHEILIIQSAPYKPVSQDSQNASIPSLCGMLVYNDVTSIETRMVPEGRFENNQ
jgi:hypothetical protein